MADSIKVVVLEAEFAAFSVQAGTTHFSQPAASTVWPKTG